MKSPVLFLSLVLCSIFSLCNCVNITEFEEGPCTATKYTTVVEKAYSSESDEFPGADVIWYTPILSKYELYQTASLVSGIPIKDLTDDDIKKSCLISKLENGKFYLKGFYRRKIEIVVATGKFGGFRFKIAREEKYLGEFWVTLIAKDFFVTVTCWSNGHRSFSAASKSKTFDAETKEKVIKHVTSLGFNPKYIHEYSYPRLAKRI